MDSSKVKIFNIDDKVKTHVKLLGGSYSRLMSIGLVEDLKNN